MDLRFQNRELEKTYKHAHALLRGVARFHADSNEDFMDENKTTLEDCVDLLGNTIDDLQNQNAKLQEEFDKYKEDAKALMEEAESIVEDLKGEIAEDAKDREMLLKDWDTSGNIDGRIKQLRREIKIL